MLALAKFLHLSFPPFHRVLSPAEYQLVGLSRSQERILALLYWLATENWAVEAQTDFYSSALINALSPQFSNTYLPTYINNLIHVAEPFFS